MKTGLITIFFFTISLSGIAQTNTFPSSGYVGIGTPSPTNVLSIIGPNQNLDLTASTIALEQQYIDLGNNDLIGSSQLFKTNNGYNSWALGAIAGVVGTPVNISGYPGGLAFFTKSANENTQGALYERMRIDENGKLGIGTTTPDEKLTVKGKIHAEEVKVDLLVLGPDYVFEKDYALTPLSEIQKYIQENKHLPEVPSAKEMEKNGINLSEMNMLLLKKVEELTLHLIEKDNELKKQNDLILRQEKRLQKVEKMIKIDSN